MATRVTARIPTTPEVQEELRRMVKQAEGVDTYDDLLRRELLTRGSD